MSMTPYLHREFPGLRKTLPYMRLGTGPTPVRPLVGLSDGRAPLWCKDESHYGDGGWGGNKVRKLEWLLPDVQGSGRTTIFSVGALGTNWGLATALYAKDLGLKTVLALVDQPVDDHVRAQLDRLRASGAQLYFTHSKARTVVRAPWLLARHARRGRLPYYMPAGGSSPVGALGYVEAALELGDQVRRGDLPEPSHIVTAVGSGGTAAGLALGLRLARLRTRVVGVVVSDALPVHAAALVKLARRIHSLLRERGAVLPAVDLSVSDLDVITEFLGPAYGHATIAGQLATRATAAEGLVLEPVYTAKAMAALLAHNAQQRFGDGPVLYLHTNGPR